MNESQVWAIHYAKELQGLVIADQEIDSHYYDICPALLNTFFNYNHAYSDVRMLYDGHNKANKFYLFI